MVYLHYMTTFILILLTVAYTLGLVTLTVQAICYIKGIEYRETLWLTVNFLLLIVIMNVREINPEIAYKTYVLFIENIILIFLGGTITLNMHAERVVSHLGKRNRWLYFLVISVLILSSVLFLLEDYDLARAVVNSSLTIFVVYSMLLTFFSKPSLLIRHREQQERLAAKIILLFFGLYLMAGYVNNRFQLTSTSLFEGPVLISLIFIFLAISKLTDDIQRLGLFAQKPSDMSKRLEILQISPREKDVARLLLQGITYNEISEKLFISLPTVKSHVTNIYKKLGVKNKVELMNLLLSDSEI